MGVVTNFVKTLKTDQDPASRTLVHNQSKQLRNQRSRAKDRSTTVGSLLSCIKPYPQRSLLLGQCADALPFLIELGNPELGAILVSCEKGSGKTHQLQVMAESATLLNTPSQLQIAVLTFKPDEWQTWQISTERKKYLQGVFAWYDPRAENILQSLVDMAEARREDQRLGADVLLILDDLNFVEELSYEAQLNLHWLLEYGSQSGIWLVGSINAHQALAFRYWVDPFRTRIIGRVKLMDHHEILAMQQGPGTEKFEPAMFRTWLDHAWCSYRLPLLGH